MEILIYTTIPFIVYIWLVVYISDINSMRYILSVREQAFDVQGVKLTYHNFVNNSRVSTIIVLYIKTYIIPSRNLD